MASAQLVLCAALAFIVIQAATATYSNCGCHETHSPHHGYTSSSVSVGHGYDGDYGYGGDHGYGYGGGDYGYGSGYGYGTGYGHGSGYGHGYGYGSSKVVKLPIIKKTTVVRQPFVHETRQAVVTVHTPAVKNTYAQKPHVSHSVQKACKSYVQNEAPVVVPHPVIPTPTCHDNEGSYHGGSYHGHGGSYHGHGGSYHGGSYSAPHSYSHSDISYSTPEVHSSSHGHSSYAPSIGYGHGYGHGYNKGKCGCGY